MTIKIADAIASGQWYKCTSRGGGITFLEIRLLSFQLQKINVDTIMGVLKIKIRNLRKIPLSDNDAARALALKNENDYEFWSTAYSFNAEILNPLIKYSAQLSFPLPANNKSEYSLFFSNHFIGPRDGNISVIDNASFENK